MKRKKFLVAFLILVLISGAANLSASAAPSASLTCTMYHTVKGGESLQKIAKKYKVSTGWLALVNDLPDGKALPEHKLCVQLTDTAKAKPACTQIHIVQRGEDLTKIANNYGLNVHWLIEINGLKNPDYIYAGNQICIQTVNGSGPAPVPVPTAYSVITGIPTFSISSVERNQRVTIQTSNFPASDSFDVLMGRMGTRAINGIVAGTIETGKGGSFTVTLEIPPALYGLSQIAIRMQSADSGYFAYNWFYNTTTP